MDALLPPIKEIGLGSPDAPVWKETLLRLHLNENPFPLPSEIFKAARVAIANAKLYPDMDGFSLREAAAKAHGLTKDHVIASSGSVEILGLLHRAFLAKGDIASMLAPGFTLNRKFAQLQEASLVEVGLSDDYVFPLEELIEASYRSKFLLIANPNNPTGTFVPASTIASLLDAVSCLVIIDEAYADFAPESVLPLVDKYPHLLVLRSFSKSYAMAGLRVGLGFGHPDVMRCLRRLQNEFSLNVVGQCVAIAVLKRKDLFLDSFQEIRAQRERLSQILLNHGFIPVPSHANFILARVPAETSGGFWKKALANRGILIASFDESALKNHVRISVGTSEQMTCVDLALAQITAENIATGKGNLCT